MSDNSNLCRWLRANSSGIYRQAATAADVIEYLEAQLQKAKIDTKPTAILILRDIIESEHKDPENINTVCVSYQRLERLIRSLLSELENNDET